MTFLSILSIDRVEDVARSEESKKRTDDDPNNKRTPVFPSLVHVVTIQQNEKIIRRQLITRCSSDRSSPRLSSSPVLILVRVSPHALLLVCMCTCVLSTAFSLCPGRNISLSYGWVSSRLFVTCAYCIS